MKLTSVIFISAATFALSGCSYLQDLMFWQHSETSELQQKNRETQPVVTQNNNVKAMPVKGMEHRRLNTAQCSVKDDWYLDGYRVGKSFRNQKAAMYEQRLSICGYSKKSVPQSYRSQWEQGYRYGLK